MISESGSSLPPSSNTGGKFHTPVSIDWLSFTFPEEAAPLPQLQDTLSRWFDCPVVLSPRKGGRLGFDHCADVVVPIEGQGSKVAIVAWGGEAQKGRTYVSLPGAACTLIQPGRWADIQTDLATIGARLTRVDLACDDLEGEFSVDLAAQWYIGGDFNTGGRMPSHSTHGGWLVPDGSGRTLYVGKSINGKMLRVYEKGKQLGDVASPWVRWELQLGNKDRVIPLDVLTHTSEYFAGGYGCLARVVDACAAKIKVVKLQLEKSLLRLTSFARASYGKLVHVLMQHHGGDLGAVVQLLRRTGAPSSLSAAWSAANPFLMSGSAG